MQKSLIITIVVVALVGVSGIFFVLQMGNSNSPTPQPSVNSTGGPYTGPTSVTPTQSQPDSTKTGSLVVVATIGSPIEVNNFKSDPQTVKDTNNAGYYYLSGGLNPTNNDAPFSTFFLESDQSFNITLLAEPIDATRKTAEQELMKKLGITQNVMCRLNYWIGVPYEINPIYAGKNLGWSFCPGATQL